METKSTIGIGSIVGLSALIIILYIGANSLGNNQRLTTAVHYLQTGNPSLDYRQLAKKDALDAGIDDTLFVWQINQESGFNPNAVSPAGAIGIAQFEPATAAGLGINPYDPVQSLSGAASLMARYYVTYQSYPKALAAYNAGTATLNTAIAEYGANWEIGLPSETRNYITAIMGVQ